MQRRIWGFVTALVVLGLLGASCKAGDDKVAYVAPTTTVPHKLAAAAVPPPGIPAPTKLALSAVATGAAVNVFDAPGSATVKHMLSNPTSEGMPLAFFVVDRQDDWLQVRMPMRPNNDLCWIKAADVQTAPVDNRIVISVSQHNLRLLDKAQKVIWETTVATGKPRTPTLKASIGCLEATI